jgi:hypothetical protein
MFTQNVRHWHLRKNGWPKGKGSDLENVIIMWDLVEIDDAQLLNNLDNIHHSKFYRLLVTRSETFLDQFLEKAIRLHQHLGAMEIASQLDQNDSILVMDSKLVAVKVIKYYREILDRQWVKIKGTHFLVIL